MNSVSAAWAAVSRGRFDELAALLASDIDWRGLVDPDGHTPRCHGRATALSVMENGHAARGTVTVQEFVERGDRVLARVLREGEDGEESVHFVVAEVRDGEIVSLRAYRDEHGALLALGTGGAAASGLGTTLLQASEICKSFGSKRVLDRVSLEVRAGDPTVGIGAAAPAGLLYSVLLLAAAVWLTHRRAPRRPAAGVTAGAGLE